LDILQFFPWFSPATYSSIINPLPRPLFEMPQTKASAMDVAARSLDLINIVSKSSGNFTEAGLELLQWLGRAQISNDAFSFALSKGQDFAQPNEQGRVVLSHLDISASRLYGLRLIIPGALGRCIMLDPKLRWLASTAAVFLRYRDLTATSHLLIDLLVFLNIERGDLREDIYKERMSPVVEKMTSSIALHSVNMGQGVKDLPDALLNLPRQRIGHQVLVDAIIQIQRHSYSSLLCEMQYSELILMSWTYHHWNGKLVVVVDNTIIFQQQMGAEPRALTVLITEPLCGEVNCTNDDHKGTVRIAVLKSFNSMDADYVYEGEFSPGS
jgi:hypothetical protein